MPIECKCGTCGKKFFVKPYRVAHGRGRYCSKACHNKSKGDPPVKRLCERCGEEFVTSAAPLKHGHGRFCSITCAKGYPSVIKKCKTCEKESQIHYTHALRGDGDYCSQKCFFNRPDRPDKKVIRVCNFCKKEFSSFESEVKLGRGIFCSQKCHHKSQCGPEAPNWRGGISFEPYCEKWNEKFKERIRDKFGRKCFLCPTKKDRIKLCVHHIDYAKNSICNGKEWAFVPLCQSHHAATNWNRWYWFNLLISYWLLNPDISLRRFPFATI